MFVKCISKGFLELCTTRTWYVYGIGNRYTKKKNFKTFKLSNQKECNKPLVFQFYYKMLVQTNYHHSSVALQSMPLIEHEFHLDIQMIFLHICYKIVGLHFRTLKTMKEMVKVFL